MDCGLSVIDVSSAAGGYYLYVCECVCVCAFQRQHVFVMHGVGALWDHAIDWTPRQS